MTISFVKCPYCGQPMRLSAPHGVKGNGKFVHVAWMECYCGARSPMTIVNDDDLRYTSDGIDWRRLPIQTMIRAMDGDRRGH